MEDLSEGVPGSVLAFLEDLGLEARPAEPRFFEDLYLAFQRRVPFQRAEVRGVEEVLTGFTEDGRGACDEARTRAFSFVARALGFDTRLVRGIVRRGPRQKQHLSLIARLGTRDVLADVAFPLPVLLPLDPPAREVPTAYGKVSIAREDEEIAVLVESRGETREGLRFDPHAQETDGLVFSQEVDAEPCLFRLLEDRILLWQEGRMQIIDPWSRLTYPLAGLETDALGALFQQPLLAPFVAAAAEEPATLSVYHATTLTAEECVKRLTSPETHAAALAAGLRLGDVRGDDGGWTWTVLDADGRELRRERMLCRPDGIEVQTLAGETPVSEKRLRVSAGTLYSRLRLSARLLRPIPPRGPSESVRKTLVFHLAAELMALTRI